MIIPLLQTLKAGEAGLDCASGRSGILAQQPASRFCAAAESPSSDEEAYARRYTKTAGCKQDKSGARGGRYVSTPPDKPEAKDAGLCERKRPGARK